MLFSDLMVNLSKVSRVFLSAILLSSMFLPSMVKAGVVTGEMVEVEEETQQELDTYRIKLDECESSRYRLEAKAKELDDKIAALVAKLKEIAGANVGLQSDIDGLKAENQQLLSERINNVKEAVTTTTTTTTETTKKTESNGTCNAHPVKSTLGVIIGTPFSTVDGTVRGAFSKGVQVSDKVSEKLGDSLPAQLVSKTFGFVFGAVPGAVTGLIKGFVDGIYYGICSPFTAKSISLDGHFINDWDAFDIPGDL
jgi:hypothetical protein